MRMYLLPVLFFLSVPKSLVLAGKKEGKNGVSLVYLDLETSGLSTAKCEILQIAAKAGDREFEKFILPENYIPKRASLCNHITKQDGKLYDHGIEVPSTDVKNALISFIQFLKEVAAPKKQAALVAHNGNRFDIPIILREMKRNELLEQFFEIVESSIDTLEVLRAKLPKRKSYKLGVLAEQYGINTDNAHNGVADVGILRELIQRAGITDAELKSFAKSISQMAFPG